MNLDIFFNIIPLYLIIFIGYLSGKFLTIENKSIAKILIYSITPLVIFNTTFTVNLSFNTFAISITFFLLCTLICLLAYFLLAFVFVDSRRNILAFSAAWGNLGYFGLPLAIGILGEEAGNIVILAVLGIQIFFATIGMYIVSQGNFSLQESLKIVFTNPMLPMAIIGFLFNALGLFQEINKTQEYVNFIKGFTGAYSLLGIMLIGLGLSKVKNFELDFKFISISFLAKFLIWPVIVLGLITLDRNFLNVFNNFLINGNPNPNLVYKTFIVLSLVPMGANVVALATEYDTYPKTVSITVFLSYIFGLLFIPLGLMILSGFL